MIIFSSCPHVWYIYLSHSIFETRLCTKNEPKLTFSCEGDGGHVLPEEAERHPCQQDFALRLDRAEETPKLQVQATEQIVFRSDSIFQYIANVNTFKSEPCCMYPCVSLPVPNKAENIIFSLQIETLTPHV